MHRRAQSPLRRKGSILNPASPRHPFAKPAVQPPAAALPASLCETGRSAHGRGGFPPPVCKTARSAPRPRRFPASRVRNRPFCPRPRRFPASRVRNRPLCPRPLLFPAFRVRNRPFYPRPLDFPSTPPSSPTSGPPLRRRFASPSPPFPPRPCAAAPPRLSLLSSHALAKRSSYPIPPYLP